MSLFLQSLGGLGGRSGNRCGPLSSGRGAGNFHKRGTSDIASITGSISDSDEPNKPLAAATLDPHQLSLLNKSRSDPSFEGGDDGALLHFKSADPLHLCGSKSPHGTDSPCSITSRLSAPDYCEDLEVEKINAPIQPITISARAPMAVKGTASSREAKRSAMASTASPASGTSSVRYSIGGSRNGTGTASELLVDEIDLAAAPSAATLKKLNRRLPSSNSLTAMLAAEAAASNNGQVASGAAVTAAMSLKSDGDDDVVTSAGSSKTRKGGSGDGQSTSSVEIGKGTVEKLRNSYAGVGSSPGAGAGALSTGGKSVFEDSPSPLKDPSFPRPPPKARWTQSISSASATMAVTALTSPGLRPDVIMRRFSSTVPRSYGSDDGIASSASTATGATASPSLSNDIANRCAAVLKIDKAAFLALTPEGPMKSGGGGEEEEECYSFIELVRRNFTKEYEGLIQSDLEKYLVEDEFFKVFQKDKVRHFIFYYVRMCGCSTYVSECTSVLQFSYKFFFIEC
jgi:hypothetical protein